MEMSFTCLSANALLRRQKVIEEAPSSVLTPELRNKMGEAAVNVAKAANYYNAGNGRVYCR